MVGGIDEVHPTAVRGLRYCPILENGRHVLTNDNQQTPDSEEELAYPRSEEATHHDKTDVGRTKGSLPRRILAGALAVLAVVALVLATQAAWVKTTLQNEEQFVATLQSLPQNEAVATALSIRVADGVVEATGVEVFVSEALPDELSFLAVPTTAAITDFVSGVAFDVIQSDAVTTAWTATLRITHKAVSAMLTGNDGALVAAEGKIALDLDAIGAVVVDRVEARGLDLPDLDISLGQVVIYEDEDLAAAQAVAQAIDTLGWLLPVLAIILIAGAVWASPNNRRMTQYLGFGTALVMLLSLATLRIGRTETVDGADSEIEAEAAGAVWDILFTPMVKSTWALTILALIVGLVAWATGPSERAIRFRGWISRTLDSWRGTGDEPDSKFTAFLAEWKRTIQVVAVVIGLIFVLFGPVPSGLLVIITGLLVLVVLVVVELLAGPERTHAESVDNASR